MEGIDEEIFPRPSQRLINNLHNMKKFLFTISLALLIFGLEAQQKSGSQLADGQQPAVYGITYAVVVGISDYQDKDIPDLRFAETRCPSGSSTQRKNSRSTKQI
jgi:hypothetical protein